MLLIGVDDTDSPDGGCTTALAHPLLEHFSSLHPEGPPRLVRLNPNVPWKTRGNAALALRFSQDADLQDALAQARRIVMTFARPHPATEPGIVVAREAPPASLYEDTVTRVVERAEVESALAKVSALWWGGRGVIGAAAALAWPAKRTSWERIAYRADARLATPRDVEAPWVREVEWAYRTTFDSYDLENDEVVCVPSGPDPVLWGIRGDDPGELERASAILGPERPARETLFLTNQATDDHLRDRPVADCRALESARVRGRVGSEPIERNGTVTFEVEDGSGALRCAAYPPTRGFRLVARALAIGDEVTACGGLQSGPDGRLTLGLEKLRVHATVPRRAGPPACVRCGRAMQSTGRAAGFRCRACGTRAADARTAVSILRAQWYEVPASARRHLAAPLRRAGRGVSM